MEPSKELLAQLAADDQRQTRAMTPAQKFRAGGDLFDEACRWTLAGIHSQFPHYTDEQAMAELRRRLEESRRREDGRAGGC